MNVRSIDINPKRRIVLIKTAILCLVFSFFCLNALRAAPGAPIWTNIYDGPASFHDDAAAIALSGGNVYVTGHSFASGTYDYTTLAYSLAGVPLWTNRYNDLGNGNDYATAIAVGSNGNVYVTGQSAGVMFDYATIAYSHDGIALWTNRYDGTAHGDDTALALTVDKNGNVLVTGVSSDDTNTIPLVHWVTIKYSALGLPLWTNHFFGSIGSTEEPAALAADGSGNVVVVGATSTVHNTTDFAILKYSGAGLPLWTNYYDGTNHGNDDAVAVVIDAGGNVYVTGSGWQSGSTFIRDGITLAISSAGVPLWTNRFNGSANGDDEGGAIALDSHTNILVGGYAQRAGTILDYFTVKYSNAGGLLWSNYYDGAAGNETVTAIGLDSNDNVYITGFSTGSGTSYDCATVGYSSAGTFLWANRYNGIGNGNDYGESMVVDPNGDIYVTGIASGITHRDDYLTLKYAGAGGVALAPIPLTMQKGSGKVVLSWTDATFNLQSANLLNGSFSDMVGATSPYTNAISGSQKYFRLHAP